MNGQNLPRNPLDNRKEKGKDPFPFKAKVHYLASNRIVTIPSKVTRELGLNLGDVVIIR